MMDELVLEVVFMRRGEPVYTHALSIDELTEGIKDAKEKGYKKMRTYVLLDIEDSKKAFEEEGYDGRLQEEEE